MQHPGGSVPASHKTLPTRKLLIGLPVGRRFTGQGLQGSKYVRRTGS